MGRVILLFLTICLSTTICFADEPADFLKNVEISIKSLQQTQETNISKSDEKIAKAIAEASAYARAMGEDNVQFPYEIVILVVKKCRYFYDKEKLNISFVKYIKKDLDKYYVNCEHWILYYPAFFEEDL